MNIIYIYIYMYIYIYIVDIITNILNLYGIILSIRCCSDKIARWSVTGLQGALLSHIVKPIYLRTLVVGELFDEDALHRAICSRLSEIALLVAPYAVHLVRIIHTQLRFPFSQPSLLLLSSDGENGDVKLVAAAGAICWARGVIPNSPCVSEVLVQGRKQGHAVKKGAGDIRARSILSKISLFHAFKDILPHLFGEDAVMGLMSVVGLPEQHLYTTVCYEPTTVDTLAPQTPDSKPSFTKDAITGEDGASSLPTTAGVTYRTWKHRALAYQDAKRALMDVFEGWAGNGSINGYEDFQ